MLHPSDIQNSMSDFEIHQVEYTTKTGFSFFASRIQSNLEHKMFEELLDTLRSDEENMDAFQKQEALAHRMREALPLFLIQLATKYGLHQDPNSSSEVSLENWQTLINHMKEDWSRLIQPYLRFQEEVTRADLFLNKTKRANNKTFYLNIYEHGKAPDFLRTRHSEDENFTSKIAGVLNSIKRKKAALKAETDKMERKNADIRKKMGLFQHQRLSNIQNQISKIKQYKEETMEVQFQCYNLAKCSNAFKMITRHGRKPIVKLSDLNEMLKNEDHCYSNGQYNMKLFGYSSSYPLPCTTETYIKWKEICADTDHMRRVKPSRHLKEGKEYKKKTAAITLPGNIQYLLTCCNTLGDAAREISKQANELREAYDNKSVTSWFKTSKEKENPKVAKRLEFELEDLQQSMENIEGIIYSYLKDPIKGSARMVEEHYCRASK